MVATLQSIDISAELGRRPARTPDHAAENRALVALAERMASSPKDVLDTVARAALELCAADSSGISIAETEGGAHVFRWRAVAGAFAPLAGTALPYDASPCGVVVARATPMLVARPERHFSALAGAHLPIAEALLVPFLVANALQGTLWVVAHGESRHFDAEDARLLASLARFASLALQTVSLRDTERALEASEVRFREFMEHLPGLAWIKDLDGRYVFANGAAQQAFQKTAAELIGKTDAETFPPAVAAQFAENDLRALERESGLETIETLEHGDGVHHSLVAKFPIPGTDGTPSLVGGVAIDITARLQAEEVLRESEERFREMADNSPAIIYTTQPDGYCTFLSSAWTQLTGRAIEQGLGFGWGNAVHPDDLEHTRAVFAPKEVPAPFRVEFRLVHADGGYHWVIGSGAPRLGRSGEFLGFVGSVLDVDKEKRTEQALREVDRRKDEFLATLGHELRNPLAPIRNSLHILRVAGLAEAEHLHGMIERQVGHLVRLVDDLLEVGRMTSGKIELRRERVELAAVVRAGVETSRPAIERAQHVLDVSLPEERLWLDADTVRLAQVVSNLLNNAAKYTEGRGTIWLRARREDRWVTLSVRDTGVGIPPEMLSRVFDLFTQIDTTLGRAQGGLGIGLALVKRLVELHGGSVEARSAGLNAGSEFVVRLPLAPRRQAGPDEPPVEHESLPRVRRRVLVVDDNRDAADSLALLLRHEGAEAEVAYDGATALERARALRPEIVLLDLAMPGMDGFEVAAKVREVPGLERAVIVALTGWGQPEHRERTAAAGFDSHLVKPVTLPDLRKLLRAPRPAPPMQ